METIITSHSVSSLSLKNHSIKPKTCPSVFHCSLNLHPFPQSVKLQYCPSDKLKPFSQKGIGGSVRASVSGQTGVTDSEDRWILEPVGDGDSRHIGFKVALPSAFEISSSEVTVGRVPEKADIVIPVATVSGTHARFLKKGGELFVMDLESTNGTFIDEKRLTAGVPYVVPAGRYVTFGDTNLAIFRVSKVRNVQPIAKSSDSEPQVEVETEGATNVVESASQNT